MRSICNYLDLTAGSQAMQNIATLATNVSNLVYTPQQTDQSGFSIPFTATLTHGEAYTLNIDGATGLDGSVLTGTVNVKVTSSDTSEGATGVVYNGTATFDGTGHATVSITLTNVSGQVLTVKIDGVTKAKEVNVTVQ